RGAQRARSARAPTRRRWQNDPAAARLEPGRAASGADRAGRPRLQGKRARPGALRADGGGQGMRGSVRWCVAAVAALSLAACAGRRDPAPVVDRGPGAKAPAAKAAAPAAAPGQAAGEDTYTVKRGDTLYSIALEHGA